MAFYIICGLPDCKQFAHASYVAHYLYERLPNFKYRKIEKSREEWPEYVDELNKKNKWFMLKSPIIWKEISAWGGKSYLIGGLANFWEYCYCYYGLESTISKDNLQKLADDHAAFFEEKKSKSLKENIKYNAVITILGAGQIKFTEHLLEDILQIPYFNKDNGFYVKLFEEFIDDEESKRQKQHLENIVEYYNSLATFGSRPVIEIIDEELGAIRNCDILLFLEDYSRRNDEDHSIWIKRCLARAALLADVINVHAKRELKVIFCNEGPRCFMATCMVELCTSLLPYNIVALSADRGLSAISVISEITAVSVEKIGAPPVWGFIGINEYVDEANILFKAHVYKPYKRALTAPEESTITLGTAVTELRLMSYLLPQKHDSITAKVEERKKLIRKTLGRHPILANLRSLNTLLKFWYSESPSDEIISLCVCSNGFYGIPPGLVFSQPCILNKKQRWKPFGNYPVMNETTLKKIQEHVEEAMEVIGSIGFRVNANSSGGSELSI